MSWDDFVVFQTLLKRPDADYYIAFQYFDVYARNPPCSAHMIGMADVCCVYRDGSGTITFDEFKSGFSAEIGPDAIPFNFDWCVLVVLQEPWMRVS
jgi:solute carrier family 25 aspartate/glutamate transporter 12/13